MQTTSTGHRTRSSPTRGSVRTSASARSSRVGVEAGAGEEPFGRRRVERARIGGACEAEHQRREHGLARDRAPSREISRLPGLTNADKGQGALGPSRRSSRCPHTRRARGPDGSGCRRDAARRDGAERVADEHAGSPSERDEAVGVGIESLGRRRQRRRAAVAGKLGDEHAAAPARARRHERPVGGRPAEPVDQSYAAARSPASNQRSRVPRTSRKRSANPGRKAVAPASSGRIMLRALMSFGGQRNVDFRNRKGQRASSPLGRVPDGLFLLALMRKERTWRII